MNFIEADLITVDIKSFRRQIYIESLVRTNLKKPFKLGKASLNKLIMFTVTKVENATHIYELLPSLNEIKVISKDSTEAFETKELFTFLATPTKTVYFPKSLKVTEQLFGLDEIEKTVIKHLYEGKNAAICLHGPSGNGKTKLVNKLNDVCEDKHFFYLEPLRIRCYKNELDNVIHSIKERNRFDHKIHSVLVINGIDCYDNDFDNYEFHLLLKHLLNDRKIDIKILMIASNYQSINIDIEELILHKIAVPNIGEKDRMCFVKYLINKFNGRENFEEGFEELIESLHGFSAVDIAKFISFVGTKYPELRLEQLMECVKREEMTPMHLQKCVKDIDPLYWTDIGGYEDVKLELRRIFQLPLMHKLAIPKGVLLHGPPGCSKTMFARALATECKLKLITLTPSSVMRGIVGESESTLRSLLSQALDLAPSIIFIDEIDTLIPKRTSQVKPSVGEHLLTELITFLDGIETKKNQKVILMAATNRLDCVDEALIRPGRMNLLIKIGLPDQEARISILRIVFSDGKYKVEKDVIERIPDIAKLLENKSGAEVVDVGRRIKKLSARKQVSNSIPIINVNHISEIIPDFDSLSDRLNSLSV